MTKKQIEAEPAPAHFDLFVMSHLWPNHTGVVATVWVSAGEFGGNDSQHGPRIKIMQGDKVTQELLNNAVSVKLTQPPEILGNLPKTLKKQVVKFVNKNRVVLLRYWNFEISTPEMAQLLRKI